MPDRSVVAACPFCGVENQLRESVCQSCHQHIITLPGWAQASRAKQSSSRRRWMVRFALGLLTAAALWFNYPFIPNPIVLLFKQPSSNVTSISSPSRWSMQGANPQQTSYVPDSPHSLEGKLVRSLDLGLATHSTPAVGGGVIYIGGNFKVTAIDVNTGQTLWEKPTTGPVHGTPAVAGTMLYLGLLDKHLLALDLESGALRWDFKADSPFPGSVAVDSGIVYAGSQDGHVYALDAGSGRLIWKLGTGASVVPPPAVYEGKIFAASSSGVLYIQNSRTGDKRLRIRTGSPLVTPPVVGDDLVYVLSRGELLAFDSNARELPGQYPLNLVWAQLWLWQLPVPPPPGQAGAKWRVSLDEERGNFTFPPAITPEALYLGSDLGNIYALDAKQGNTLWLFRAAAAAAAPAIVVGQTLYVGTEDGVLYALNRFSGQLEWKVSLGAPLAAPLSFASGRLYAHTTDGKLQIIQ